MVAVAYTPYLNLLHLWTQSADQSWPESNTILDIISAPSIVVDHISREY